MEDLYACCPHSRLRDHCRKGSGKSVRARGYGRLQEWSVWIQQMYIWVYNGYASMHKPCAGPSQYKSDMERGKWTWTPPWQFLAAGRESEGEFIFPMSVRELAPTQQVMLQWKPHTQTYLGSTNWSWRVLKHNFLCLVFTVLLSKFNFYVVSITFLPN